MDYALTKTLQADAHIVRDGFYEIIETFYYSILKCRNRLKYIVVDAKNDNFAIIMIKRK